MIFAQCSKISQTLLLVILSALLFACDGESSSNSSSDNDGSGDGQTVQRSTQNIVTDEDGNRVLTVDDTVLNIDPDGNAEIVEDPSGNSTITENPDGAITINTSNGNEIATTPDGSIFQSGGDARIETNIIESEAEAEAE